MICRFIYLKTSEQTWLYNLQSNKWFNGPSILMARYGQQCALIDDKIAIVGGRFENHGINKLEFLKLEKGWSESKDNRLHGNGMALSYNGILLQNQQLLLFGGRSYKDENKDLIRIDLDIKKDKKAIGLKHQIKYVGDNPIVLQIPYGYLSKCQGK